jgi:hypothetical protein
MQKSDPPRENCATGMEPIKSDSEQMDLPTKEEGNSEDAVEENDSSVRDENQESSQPESPRKSQHAITETVDDEPDSKEQE